MGSRTVELDRSIAEGLRDRLSTIECLARLAYKGSVDGFHHDPRGYFAHGLADVALQAIQLMADDGYDIMERAAPTSDDDEAGAV